MVYGVTKYVDLDDIDNPVKLNHYGIANFGQIFMNEFVVDVELTENQIYLSDNYMSSFLGGTFENFTTSEVGLVYNQNRDDKGFIKIYFVASDTIVQYRRKVMDFFEVTGIIGGIFEIFDLFFGLLIGICLSKNFKSNLEKD